MNKDALDRILKLMQQNNYVQQADDLEALTKKYDGASQEEKKKAGVKIQQMCHPKWLGDIYIKGITQAEWFGLLDRLKKSI